MKKFTIIIFIGMIFLSNRAIGAEQFPNDKIKDNQIIELNPTKFYSFDTFKTNDLNDQKKYSGLWSTLHQVNLNALEKTIVASSVLGATYQGSNLFDGKTETAWVEGAKGNGIGEWIKIKLDAKKVSPSSTPFSVFEVGIIPGYAKSKKTWEENNRLKTALLIVHSPPISYPKEFEWVVYRLRLKDENKLQYFTLPDDMLETNSNPMTKTIWLKIEDVYKGTKFDDTCISEVVLVGGCLP